MTTVTISLQAINDVKEFVNIVMRFDFDVDLVSGMGIFSLDLSKPIELHAHTDNAKEFLDAIGKFIVK